MKEPDRLRLLIVEDETALARGLQFNFEQEGYQVDTAGDGVTALGLFDAADPPIDLVILDLMLPGMSGYEVCRELRERDSMLSILVLSARSMSEDRTLAFDCGTDQYLSKPFALPELLSRVRNLTDRKRKRVSRGAAAAIPSRTEPFVFGDDITVDFERFELNVRGTTYTLTTMEMQLLKYFIEHADRVLSRQQIMEDVWDDSAAFSTRSIDNFVLRLRKLIEPDPTAPRHFLSVRGTGYRFVAKPDN